MSKYKPIDECFTLAELFADPKRWKLGGFGPDAWCILYGIDKLYAELRYRNAAYRRVLAHLQSTCDMKNHNVSWWEERPGRTHAEVLAAVEAAGI